MTVKNTKESFVKDLDEERRNLIPTILHTPSKYYVCKYAILLWFVVGFARLGDWM